jgi:membrane protease YdiL (CAAX protease family)
LKQPPLVYWLTVIYYLDAILLTPLLEEILFRALLYGPVARKLGYRGSAAFTSLIFASGHECTVVRVIATAAIGLFFVYLYHRTRSLLPSLTLHVCGNAVGFVGELLEDLERSIALVLPATGLSLAGFLACSAIVRRTRLVADMGSRS